MKKLNITYYFVPQHLMIILNGFNLIIGFNGCFNTINTGLCSRGCRNIWYLILYGSGTNITIIYFTLFHLENGKYNPSFRLAMDTLIPQRKNFSGLKKRMPGVNNPSIFKHFHLQVFIPQLYLIFFYRDYLQYKYHSLLIYPLKA